jgi:hypothetical protein
VHLGRAESLFAVCTATTTLKGGNGMSADFWFWIGGILVVVGGGGFFVVDRLEARRERRQHEADRQARLQREIRSASTMWRSTYDRERRRNDHA